VSAEGEPRQIGLVLDRRDRADELLDIDAVQGARNLRCHWDRSPSEV
jgi:hypothetical protein